MKAGNSGVRCGVANRLRILVSLTVIMLTGCGRGPDPDYGLYNAVTEGNEAQVKEALNAGGDPNAPNDSGDNGMTPLMIAASQGRVRIIRLMMEKGGDPRKLDGRGRSAFDHAESREARLALKRSK